jgi:hypothetical protein
MKKTNFKKFLSLVLSFVLIAVVALIMTGCGDKTIKTSSDSGKTSVITPENAEATDADGNILIGEGEHSFIFKATDLDGKTTSFLVSTDKTVVGEALLDLGLINGEDGEYGLYVKVVNGIELDYETHGKYWAFYVNGEYAMSGVDTTDIENGATYEFRPEK